MCAWSGVHLSNSKKLRIKSGPVNTCLGEPLIHL
jgi:hypothetical protein